MVTAASCSASLSARGWQTSTWGCTVHDKAQPARNAAMGRLALKSQKNGDLVSGVRSRTRPAQLSLYSFSTTSRPCTWWGGSKPTQVTASGHAGREGVQGRRRAQAVGVWSSEREGVVLEFLVRKEHAAGTLARGRVVVRQSVRTAALQRRRHSVNNLADTSCQQAFRGWPRKPSLHVDLEARGNRWQLSQRRIREYHTVSTLR